MTTPGADKFQAGTSNRPLQVARQPDALHQHKHGGEEDERAPVDTTDYSHPVCASGKNRRGRSKGDIREAEIDLNAGKHQGHFDYQHRRQNQKRDATQLCQGRIGKRGVDVNDRRAVEVRAIEQAQHRVDHQQAQQCRQHQVLAEGDEWVGHIPVYRYQQILRIPYGAHDTAHGDSRGKRQQ
jgi:hypothetical protein